MGIPSSKQVEIADYVGIVSGREHDKFKETGLTLLNSKQVNAPIASEFPFTLECKLSQHHKLGSHTLFVGEIVGILSDEDVLGDKGLPDIEKTNAMIYGGFGSSCYYSIGENLGKAFSVGKDLH